MGASERERAGPFRRPTAAETNVLEREPWRNHPVECSTDHSPSERSPWRIHRLAAVDEPKAATTNGMLPIGNATRHATLTV